MTGTVNPPPGAFLPRLPRARGDRSINNFGFATAAGTTDTRTFEDWLAVVANLEGEAINVVNDFGVDNTGTVAAATNNTRLAAVATYIRSLYLAGSPLPALIFPPGIYPYSSWPDLTYDNLQIRGIGQVKLRYSGTGNAVDFSGRYSRNMVFSNFVIEAPSTAGNGLRIDDVHISTFEFINVRGCGTSSAAFKLEYMVANRLIALRTSNNDGAFYQSGKPKWGLHVDKGSVYQTIDCYFNVPVMEGVEIGCYVDHGTWNKFDGGTFEGCTDTGLYCTANSKNNIFSSMVNEANTNYDLVELGQYNAYRDFSSAGTSRIGATSKWATLENGWFNSIAVLTSAVSCRIDHCIVNYVSPYAGGITDAGTSTRITDCVNLFAGTNLTNQFGSYTPTATGVANVTSVTAQVCQYFRNGGEMSVGFRLSVTPTAGASTLTTVRLTKPPGGTSTIGSTADVIGSGCVLTSGIPVWARGDTGNNELEINFLSGGTSAVTITGTLMYLSPQTAF